MSRPTSVVVVGAGVAGLCCAFYLRKRGLDVVVVESNRIGSGASWGNGGWLCPAQAGPLPEPGLTLFGLRSLFDSSSPLYIKPANLTEIGPWLVRFWTYCNDRDYREGVAAVARLGQSVFALVDEMVDEGVEFELHREGMLVVSRDPKVARGELRKLEPARALGYELPEEILTGAELRELEPALAPEVDGGFYVPQHWHVRPDSFTAGIAKALRAQDVEIFEGAEVNDFKFRNGRVVGVRTAAGEFEADAFVLAAGAWTTPLARMLDIELRMQAGKGYSFFVTPSLVPRHSILLCDAHVGCTPLGDKMRIGGTLEFSGINTRVDRGRIEAIAGAAQSAFLPWATEEIQSEWAGMRPITADGLPVLDRDSNQANVFVATGYSMQGMTVASPAGLALAEFVATGNRPPILEPFQLERLRHLRTHYHRARHNGHV